VRWQAKRDTAFVLTERAKVSQSAVAAPLCLRTPQGGSDRMRARPGNSIPISLSSRRDDSRVAQPFKVGSGDFMIAQVPKGRLNACICPTSVLTTIVSSAPKNGAHSSRLVFSTFEIEVSRPLRD
jgi:hypothetical protein